MTHAGGAWTSMWAAEGTARRLGHDRISLTVGRGNPDARRLYERLGYVDWARGARRGHLAGARPRHEGMPVTLSPVCDVLVKNL